MASIGKKGNLRSISIGLDVIGFALILLGAGIIRFSKTEPLVITGGIVMAFGVASLSFSRYVVK